METINKDLFINDYSNNKDSINIHYSIMNIKSKRNKKEYSAEKARQRALYIADKLGNPSGILFYLKCAWNLTDEYLDWLLNYSLTKIDKIRYFSKVASLEMVKNNC